MDIALFKLRIKKLFTSLTHKNCWKALSLGVAPAIEHLSVLKKIKPDAVLDVGANKGQFSLVSTMIFRDIPIISFEPIPEEANIYKKIHGDNQKIQFFECAVGEESKTSKLHLSKSADSSSMLPIGNLQSKIFLETHEVGTLDVKVERLDDFKQYFMNKNEILLKIDVQGFELSVLKGSIETLKRCRYVYVECSEVSLYEGQALRKEVESFLKTHGFSLQKSVNEFFVDHKLIQADHLFVREAYSA